MKVFVLISLAIYVTALPAPKTEGTEGTEGTMGTGRSNCYEVWCTLFPNPFGNGRSINGTWGTNGTYGTNGTDRQWGTYGTNGTYGTYGTNNSLLLSVSSSPGPEVE